MNDLLLSLKKVWFNSISFVLPNEKFSKENTTILWSPTYQLSKHLVKILWVNLFFYVKNSKESASFVSIQKLDNNSILVFFDVVSLFTSIPIDRAIEVARKRLLADDSLEDNSR